jgi:adenylosuccinate synthase
MNSSLEAAGSSERVSAESLLEDVKWICDNFSSSIAHTGLMLDNALKLGEHVILEGAQGCLLDIDQGTFPYVTSSVILLEEIQPMVQVFILAMLTK